VAIAILAAAGDRMRVERIRILDTAYFLDSANRSVLAALPGHDVPVEIEGFNESLRAPGELPLVMALVNERTDNHASLALNAPDYSANAYLGPSYQPQLLDPNYRYVLTRFTAVITGRRTIARSGGIALEERIAP
jgi:hypothetical protein